MKFIADLHIHSRFSMATSKQLNVPHLASWAMRKGINVLGTGDFTHPQWRAELARDLQYDEKSGFYRCGKETQSAVGSAGPFFCLQAEISSIYKRGGKTRKVHNLVYAPNLEAAEKISARLALVGNLNSDGRPILGLDSHDLLEIVLECDSILVPAHIWTPWFALFGSKSGFDRIEDCYGDLTGHIFALETGLSSDPPMNRCLSALDNYALISNSDAHSGANLGREANLFTGEPTWQGMFDALRLSAQRKPSLNSACSFLGTLEFYPEEGKYHLDGHRACNVALTPAESRELKDICPVCGKPLTIGVLHRVMELADRETPAVPPHEPEARMLVPLPEVISQILGSGPTSRKVQEKYEKALDALGSELDILCQLPEKNIFAWWEPLGEAVRRIRAGQVELRPGYDGQYGLINIFSAEELASMTRKPLVSAVKKTPKSAGMAAPRRITLLGPRIQKDEPECVGLSAVQQTAVTAGPGPVFVKAGPGAGKTRVLVERILKLLADGVAPGDILAITFTRRAADEMRERLRLRLQIKNSLPTCDTLHALAWRLMLENETGKKILLSDDAAKRLFRKANQLKNDQLWPTLAVLREKNLVSDSRLASLFECYQQAKMADVDCRYVDYGDLLTWLLEHVPDSRWKHVLVDEAQDLSPLQMEIIWRLAPPGGNGFFGIGDPDQSIYEFRGASGEIVDSLKSFWPTLQVLPLDRSWRSSQDIINMAGALLGGRKMSAVSNAQSRLHIFHAASDKEEAGWIADKIAVLLGPTAHSMLDGNCDATFSPSEIAVLARLKIQLKPVAAALEKRGIPYTMPADTNFWDDEQCASFMELARASQTRDSPEIFLQKLLTDKAAHSSDAQEQLSAFAQFHWEKFSPPDSFGVLCKIWRECGSWDIFWERLAWLNEAEQISLKAQSVRLLTIHASKGLEFKTVFLPGMEAGLLPLDRKALFKNAVDESMDLASERRLLYVGLTRAERDIFISYCDRRNIYGESLALPPSPFLDSVTSFCSHSRRVKHCKQVVDNLNLFGAKE